MTNKIEKLSGKCQCGKITFEIPTAEYIEACHCGTCRRMTSGPFMGIGCHDGITITADESLKWYESSDWARRGFCGDCGSALFYNLKGSEFYSVNVGALDTSHDLPLAKEYFIDQKPDFYALAGDRPRLTGEEVFASFEEEEK